MANVKLTTSRVQAIRPVEKVQRVWDSVVSGFHVRVTPAGFKSYCVTFQRQNSKAKVSVTIGGCDTWDLDAARSKARELRAMHDEGKDARAHVQAERHAQTVQDLADLWKRDYRNALKPSTRTVYDSWLKVIILPALGNRLVRDLNFEAIKNMHREEAKKHQISANRAITVLSRLLSIAEKEGWRPMGSNPCRQLEKAGEQSRTRTFTANEYASLEKAISDLGQAEKLDPQAADLFRFLALSGLRKGEAQGLRFADVDVEAGTMRFDEHKTSGKKGAKVLPLNSHLKAIIQHRSSQQLGSYVFPGRSLTSHIVGLTKMWDRVLTQANMAGVTPHDLRRTFMTTCCELGQPPAIADTLLGHSLGKIRDTYLHLDPEGILATASQETADWIAAAMAGQKVKPGVKVAKLEKTEAGTA